MRRLLRVGVTELPKMVFRKWTIFHPSKGRNEKFQGLKRIYSRVSQKKLLPKVPVLKCQKMALGVLESKNGLKKPRETPPKTVG